jgi:hypothetical protein
LRLRDKALVALILATVGWDLYIGLGFHQEKLQKQHRKEREEAKEK